MVRPEQLLLRQAGAGLGDGGENEGGCTVSYVQEFYGHDAVVRVSLAGFRASQSGRAGPR